MSTLQIEQARETLDQAFNLLHDCLPFEDWRAQVSQDVSVYAVKEHGSLKALYDNIHLEMCQALLLAHSQVQELEGTVEEREGAKE